MARIGASAALVAMVLSASTFSVVRAHDAPPANARPVSAAELREIYAGKTWAWKSGGAYFGPTGKFEAWSEDDGRKSYARGSWNVRSRGRVCFRGVWHYSGGAKDATHCFRHLKAKGTIYQSAEPGGAWMIFKSAKGGADEEYSKFEDGNQVSAQLKIVRSALRNQ